MLAFYCRYCGDECLNDKGLLYERYRGGIGGIRIIGWRRHYCMKARFVDGAVITILLILVVLVLPLVVSWVLR